MFNNKYGSSSSSIVSSSRPLSVYVGTATKGQLSSPWPTLDRVETANSHGLVSVG